MMVTRRFRGVLGCAALNVTSTDDPPDVLTAVQEQLGLKLQHGKKVPPVIVIDHIERPSEN